MSVRYRIALAAILGIAVCPEPASAQQQQIKILSNSAAKTIDAKIRACTALIKRGGRDVEAYYFCRSGAYLHKARLRSGLRGCGKGVVAEA